MRGECVIVSCEHAGAVVPPEYADWFASPSARRALLTHRGLDLGARALAHALTRRYGWPLYVCRTTRLLVDVNRSVGHPGLHSELVPRDPATRARLVARHHHPHRRRVEAAVTGAIRSGRRVLHLGVHTFTPTLHGVRRVADVGLLYDPRRRGERTLCARWGALLRGRDPELRVRRNYPYRGRADGLTTTLRRRFPDAVYAGIEIEVNQRLVVARGESRRRVAAVLAETLADLLRLAHDGR